MNLKNKTACLVGARNLVEGDADRIYRVSMFMNELNMDGRSGGATGADTEWADHVPTQEIIPYNGFNDLRQSPDFTIVALESAPADLKKRAEEIARTHHEFGDTLKGFALQAHTRNVFQALGLDLKTPAVFTAYVAPETAWGKVSGGTATAVGISRSNGIPTFNLRIDKEYRELIELLEAAL